MGTCKLLVQLGHKKLDHEFEMISFMGRKVIMEFDLLKEQGHTSNPSSRKLYLENRQHMEYHIVQQEQVVAVDNVAYLAVRTDELLEKMQCYIYFYIKKMKYLSRLLEPQHSGEVIGLPCNRYFF